MKKFILKITLLLVLVLSPIFSLAVQAQTENKIVSITDPLDISIIYCL